MDEPPPFPIFGYMRTKQTNTPAAHTPPMVPPPYMYPFFPAQSFYNGFNPVHNPASSSDQKPPAPTLSDFLKSLDKQHGAGMYTCFEKKFLDENITVSLIKHMTDAQLIELGVKQMGPRMFLKLEADKYA